MIVTLHVSFINDSCAEFRGFGSRDLYTQVAGRPPVFNTRTRAWVTSPRKASDLIAAAENLRWSVVVTDERRKEEPGADSDKFSARSDGSVTSTPQHSDNNAVLPEPRLGLW